MKRNVFLIGLMTFLGFVCQAQNDTMYVMKKGVVTHKISVKATDVDSIIFYKPQVQQNPTTITDVDGNIYKTVTIGTQTWMAENLKTTKYNDGTSIPLVTSNDTWASNYNNSTTNPMMCYYTNSTANKDTYGALYNFYVVSSITNGEKNVCPAGWHVPSDVEWTTLQNFVGTDAGIKLKTKTGWKENGDGINIYGFSGVPGGYRYNGNGSFASIGSDGYWWSSTSNDTSTSWLRYLGYDSSNGYRDYFSKYHGFSVRCVRD